MVIERTRLLDLTGVDLDASGSEPTLPELDTIYVPMDTTARAEPDGRARRVDSDGGGPGDGGTASDDCDDEYRYPAVEFGPSGVTIRPHREAPPVPVSTFVSSTRRAVLLGEPGGGKSTVAAMLALALASELLGAPESGLLRLGEGWKGSPLVPVRVVLREFAVSDERRSGGGESLWNFISNRLRSRDNCADLVDPLRRHLIDIGGLFILDGYDEVSDEEMSNKVRLRAIVRDAITSLGHQFPRAHLLVTSRPYAYRKRKTNDWLLPGFTDASLAPFTKEKQHEFIDRWYDYTRRKRGSMAVATATGLAARLKEAIANRPELRDLSDRPLLLTLMASVHARQHGTLPSGREGLYAECVDLLMDRWQRPKEVLDESGEGRNVEETVAEYLKANPEKVMRAMEKLAFEVHAASTDSRRVADIPTEKLVAALVAVGTEIHHARVVAYVRDRAGLLNDVDGGMHRFPHRTFQEYLAARHLCDDLDQLAELLESDFDRWREVFLLAGARTAKSGLSNAWRLIEDVLRTCRSDDEPRWQRESLCGALVVESRMQDRIVEARARTQEQLTGVLSDLRKRLEAILDQGRLAAVERALAGESLAIIGDTREGVGVRRDGIPDIRWIDVQPPAQGWRPRREGAPEHAPTAQFRISKYPITMAQFDAFLRATRTDSAPLEDRFAGSNKPRVNVSWHEACAFCTWLSTQIGDRVRLPTEAEWYYAAAGPEERVYPWGDWSDGAANTAESQIGSTSVVGMFPKGRSWCDAHDMAGNVWEWCHDAIGVEGKRDVSPRVLRGGSWLDHHDNARCAYRVGDHPSVRNGLVGFRVCVSPFSPSDR